MTERL